MLVVYFETENPSYAEIVAYFSDEETYDECLPALEKLAEKRGFSLVTESIQDEVELDDIQSHLKEAGIL